MHTVIKTIILLLAWGGGLSEIDIWTEMAINKLTSSLRVLKAQEVVVMVQLTAWLPAPSLVSDTQSNCLPIHFLLI